MKRHCLLILTGCLLLPFVVQCEGGVNPLDQAKLPAVGGETEELAGTASCPAGSRLLPKDADIVLSLSLARAYEAEPFKSSIGEDIKKWEEEVRKEVGTFPYKDIMTDVSVIHAAFVLKEKTAAASAKPMKPMDVPVGWPNKNILDQGKVILFDKEKPILPILIDKEKLIPFKDKLIQKIDGGGKEGPVRKPIRPAAASDPFEAFEDYGIVIEGNLDPKFDLGDVLDKAKVEAGFSVAEVQDGVFRITAPTGGQEYLVGIVDGKFVLGTKGFVEGAIDASKANQAECPLREALATLPEKAVLKVLFDLADWPDVKEKVKEAFAVAPEILQGVFALDFKDRVIVALNFFTSKNWADEPFVESLFRFNYKDLKEEIQKDLFKGAVEGLQRRISSSSSVVSKPRNPCKADLDATRLQLHNKLLGCIAWAPDDEDNKQDCTDSYKTEIEKAEKTFEQCLGAEKG